MTTYWVRQSDTGAANGTSYANAWGIANASFLSAIDTVSDAEFQLCGSFKAAQASAFTHRIAMKGGLSPSRPKIIRGDYAADPCIFWGGYMFSGTFSNAGGNIWTATGMLANAYDDEDGVAYAIYFPTVGNPVVVSRTTSSGNCDATANSFYVTGSDSNIRVNLPAGDPTGKIMLAQYGYRFQLVRGDQRVRWVHFHGIQFRPLSRMLVVDISGTSYIPHGLTFTSCDFHYGAQGLFHLRRASEIEFVDCLMYGVSTAGHVYLRTTTRDDADNTLGSDISRLQIYNSHRINAFNCDISDAGMVWKSGTADSHGWAIQAADELKVYRTAFQRSRAAILHWHTSAANARMDDIDIAHNSIKNAHNGVDATTGTLVRGIGTESGDAGDFSNRKVRNNWLGAPAAMSVTPTYPPHALRCQSNLNAANAPDVDGNVVTGWPVAIVMPSNASYVNAHGTVVRNPGGHSIVRYALGQTGQYATALCDQNDYDGIADEATMFGNAGANELSAPSTAVTKTAWTDPAGSYRHDINSVFGEINASLRPDGGYILRPDGGKVLRS